MGQFNPKPLFPGPVEEYAPGEKIARGMVARIEQSVQRLAIQFDQAWEDYRDKAKDTLFEMIRHMTTENQALRKENYDMVERLRYEKVQADGWRSEFKKIVDHVAQVKKERNGTPTVIEYQGKRYVLDHKG